LTTLRIPPIRDGADRTIPASAEIVLMRKPRASTEAWREIIVFRNDDGSLLQEHTVRAVPPDGLLIPLVPQDQIKTGEPGEETAYSVTVRWAHGSERYRVEIPESADVLDLADVASAW
jgi:hypothetical protein